MAPDDTLTLVWAGITAIAIFGYVVMEGFDLGVGISALAGKTPRPQHRNQHHRAGVGRQ